MLYEYNLVACIIHLVLGIGFMIYFPYINNKYPNNPQQGIELSIRDHVLQLDMDVNKNVSTYWESQENAAPGIETVQTMIVAFFFITAAFHLYYATSQRYEIMINAQNNYVRWIEYSITSTLMLYVIALLCGTKDQNIYYLIGVTNIVMIAQGQQIEVDVHDGRSPLVPLVSSWALLLAEFGVIARDYTNRLQQARAFGDTHPTATLQQVPSWVSLMIIVLFLFFSCFGAVSLWSAYQGNSYSYETIETMYIILSLTAKATLGFFVAYGCSIRQSQ